MISKKGFTLIELLIVIAIIGILAVAFLPNLMGAPSKARDTQRIDAVREIVGYLSEYSLTSGSGVVGGCVADGVNDIAASDFNGTIPVDPSANTPFTTACASGYWILEDDTPAASSYSFAVVSSIENIESSNSDCTGLTTGSEDIDAIATGLNPAAASNVLPCYVVLVN